MTDNLFENNLYTNKEEREALLEDKTKVMNALVLNFLGFLSLYKLSDARGAIKNYNAQEGKVRLRAISHTNNDVTVAIKLAFDARVLPMSAVNQMTRLLALIKQRQVKGKDLDDARVRAILEASRLKSNRPSPRVMAIVDDFLSGAINLDMVAGRVWQVSKLPGIQELVLEFRDIYRKGQYASLAKKAEEAHKSGSGVEAPFVATPAPAPAPAPVAAPVAPPAAAPGAPSVAPSNKQQKNSTKDLITKAVALAPKKSTPKKAAPAVKAAAVADDVEVPNQPALNSANVDDLINDYLAASVFKSEWDEKFEAVVQNKAALEKLADIIGSDRGLWSSFETAISRVMDGQEPRYITNKNIVPFYEVYGSKKRTHSPPSGKGMLSYSYGDKSREAVKAWFDASLKSTPDILLGFLKGQGYALPFRNNPVFTEVAYEIKKSGLLGEGDELIENLKKIVYTNSHEDDKDRNLEALRILIGDIETAKVLYDDPELPGGRTISGFIGVIYPELLASQTKEIVDWFNNLDEGEIEITSKHGSEWGKKIKVSKDDLMMIALMEGEHPEGFPGGSFSIYKVKDDDLTPEMIEVIRSAFENTKFTVMDRYGITMKFPSEVVSDLYIERIRKEAMDPSVSVFQKVDLLKYVYDGVHKYKEFEDIVGGMLRDPQTADAVFDDLTEYADLYDEKFYMLVSLLNKETKDNISDPKNEVRLTRKVLEKAQERVAKYGDRLSESEHRSIEYVATKLGDFLVPLAIEGDVEFVNETLNSIETPSHKKSIMKNLVESAVMSRHADAINEGHPIKPLTPIEPTRIPQMLRFNNVYLPGFDVQDGDTYETALGRANEIELNIPEVSATEEELAETEIERMTFELDKYRAGKHGDIALEIKKVFRVEIKEQVEGTASFERRKPGTEILNNAFHGTGSQAASFILRYGFTVPPATDGSVVGRMLGDGVYIADTTDKAAQYITDSGYGRGLGNQGYLFNMKAFLGEKGEDYESAGVDDKMTISPEWCVKHGNEQLLIRRAYLVELVKSDTLDSIRKKYGTMNESKIQTFSEMLTEETNKKTGRVTFSFIKGLVPVDYGKFVDYTEFDPSRFGSHVSLENGQNGPTVVFQTKDPNDYETFVFEFAQDLFSNTEATRKFFKLLKG